MILGDVQATIVGVAATMAERGQNGMLIINLQTAMSTLQHIRTAADPGSYATGKVKQ